MEHDVPFDFIRILSPAIKLLKIMPAIGRVTIEENAARRGVAKTCGAGKLLDLVILTALVELVYGHALAINRNFYTVGELLCDGGIREDQGQRDVISLAGFW